MQSIRRVKTSVNLWIALVAALLSGCAALPPVIDPPHVTLSDLRVKKLTLFEQQFEVELRLQNPNRISLPIEGMNYELFVNDKLFARGVSDQAFTVPAHGEATASIDVTSSLQGLFEQLTMLSTQKEPALNYRLNGNIALTRMSISLPFKYEGTLKTTP